MTVTKLDVLRDLEAAGDAGLNADALMRRFELKPKAAENILRRLYAQGHVQLTSRGVVFLMSRFTITERGRTRLAWERLGRAPEPGEKIRFT